MQRLPSSNVGLAYGSGEANAFITKTKMVSSGYLNELLQRFPSTSVPPDGVEWSFLNSQLSWERLD